MPLEKWPVNSTRNIFSSRIVEINGRMSVNPRNGIENEYYIADFPDWANIIALTPEKEIVLIKQYRHGTQKIEVEIPGGCVDPGEDPLDGAIRELEEETGYIGENPQYIGKVSPNPSFQSNYCHSILLENARPGGMQKLDDGEDIEVFTASLEDVENLIESGELSNSMVIAALYLLKKNGLKP